MAVVAARRHEGGGGRPGDRRAVEQPLARDGPAVPARSDAGRAGGGEDDAGGDAGGAFGCGAVVGGRGRRGQGGFGFDRPVERCRSALALLRCFPASSVTVVVAERAFGVPEISRFRFADRCSAISLRRQSRRFADVAISLPLTIIEVHRLLDRRHLIAWASSLFDRRAARFVHGQFEAVPSASASSSRFRASSVHRSSCRASGCPEFPIPFPLFRLLRDRLRASSQDGSGAADFDVATVRRSPAERFAHRAVRARRFFDQRSSFDAAGQFERDAR